ncbi:TPA: ATP-binding domain-containing protein [Stenotrophomonas maltophilia]|nr:ATP-binding domain-containing protein [Stenotrophomonas maltophilia]
MSKPDFSVLASDVLETFAEAAALARGKLDAATKPGGGLAGGNAFTNPEAFRNLSESSRKTREGWATLVREPAISRLVIEDTSGARRVLYIARKTGAVLPSGMQVANYDTVLGRLAELDVGDEATVPLADAAQTFTLLEKTTLHPKMQEAGWDSTGNLHLILDGGAFSIRSLRELLQSFGVDVGDDLDRLLEQAALADGVKAGISHQVRIAMGLRDQPILDKFQGEIFRRALDSQLIILGPPGTGKTTTLIKRLGQKLDLDALDERERRIVINSSSVVPHDSNWMMFTPSELLKHYLKEAFNREQVPATDARIQTWDAYRITIARNTLGILRSTNGGRFNLRSDQEHLAARLFTDPMTWFEAFQGFHDQRLRKQLEDGADMAAATAPTSAEQLVIGLKELATSLGSRSWMDVYRDLEANDTAIRAALDESRGVTEGLMKGERNRLFNNDRDVFTLLGQFLSGLQQDDDQDDEDSEFDDDERETTDQAGASSNDIQVAVNAYLASVRALSRSRYQKRTLKKETRAARIIAWLGPSLPDDTVLLEIGQRISFQNGLRRFLNAFRRYISDVPSSYRAFRREYASDDRYYSAPISGLHISAIELDAMILLMLRNCRALLEQSFVARNVDMQRFEVVKRVSSLFRTQIMVDEATDFSALELACMEGLAALPGRSFFACGDFNQRITTSGLRSRDQLTWVSSSIAPVAINLVYRQSRSLNAFAGELLQLMGGDMGAHGELPADSTHDGVPPALLEHADAGSASWIADRIKEVEGTVKEMPTVAVLVTRREDVEPMARQLTKYLEDISLRAVACDERTLGEGTDVRVFEIRHIKGLEFEAVFFVDVDRLAELKPDLFDRYLYVGATRAATYLGMVCAGRLPERLEALRPSFCDRWGG